MALQNVISDNSFKNLMCIPEEVLNMANLRMLYLDGNGLKSLPFDFFKRLPRLYWLDLRGNKLTAIPSGIGEHKFLENLLLQHNRIEKLPDELGLVPNLKVLQLTDNPLLHPPKNIVEKGVEGICKFLRQEYHRKNAPPLEDTKSTVGSGSVASVSTASVHAPIKKKSSKKMERPTPSVIVKGLSKPVPPVFPEKSSSDRIFEKEKKVHRITRSASKLSVRSCYSPNSKVSWGVINDNEQERRIEEQRVKDIWLNKLKDLIKDQEKILQQEKTLARLSSWRQEKKQEPPRSPAGELKRIPETPFDTNPAYNQLMSRNVIVQNVERLVASQNGAGKKQEDVDKLISDVIVQLKGLEKKLTEGENVSSSDKLRNAEEEIQLIVNLHKKIAQIQSANNLR